VKRRGRRSSAFLVFLAVATDCASRTPPPQPPPQSASPPGPQLSVVPGHPASDPAPIGCALAAWTAPWGTAMAICLESSGVEITPRDVQEFRIEDRRFGEESWYFVSAHLSEDLRNRIWEVLEAPGSEGVDDRPYAILVDGESSVVQPAIGIDQVDALVAVSQDLPRAEAIAYGWGVPVTRVISAEIATQPMRSVSMVQLIADPSAWVGKRISVQGYMPKAVLGLYLSREHADRLDHASSIHLVPPTADAAGVEALTACEGRWVLVEAFVDSDRGLLRLDHVERVTGFPDRPCWPPPPNEPRPHY
jgi:hypothetical protein